MKTNSIFYVLCFVLFFSVNVNAQIGAKVAPGVTNVKGELGISSATSADFNPSAMLHLKTTGSEMARFESTSSSKWLSFHDGITRKGILWNVGNDMVLRTDGAGSVEFQTNGFNNRMEIGSDGDIGVGITAAASRGKFHIRNSSGIDDPELNLESSGTGFSRLEFSNTAGDGYWHIAGDANGSPRMNFWFDEDGSAGPISGLNIMRINGEEKKVGVFGGTDVTLASGGFFQIGETSSANLVFDDNEIEARSNGLESDMYLQRDGGDLFLAGTKNGQVGIGMVSSISLPSSDYLLAVDGKIASEELLVELSGSWPDYVFEKTYELKTLEEVEAIIKENGHLPGIPSAKEVEEFGGIHVGDMQTRTIEKVEELTLYAIDANKKIKTLNKENEELKNSLESLIKRIEQLEKK